MPDSLPYVEFREARDYFRSLVPMTDAEWEAAEDEVRLRAFTVAHAASADMLAEVYNALERAISDGIPFSQFQVDIASAFAEHGWTGEGYRLDTIFRTNVQTAYGYGRLVQHTELSDVYPYGKYETVGDSRVRPTHRALDGQVHRMDSDFWRLHYPPWEFNCRCACIPMAEDEVNPQDISTDLGPLPDSEFQGPGYGLSFGDPWQAVAALIPDAPYWLKQIVVDALETFE